MVTCTTKALLSLSSLMSVFFVGQVDGRPPLPPLAVRDGCFHVSPEVRLLRREGEAVMLAFPVLRRVLHVRKLTSLTATYLISKGNGTGGVAEEGQGRIRQLGNTLWLLPSQSLDSGEYTCYYRNQTYCVAGSIALVVYDAESEDVGKLSHGNYVTLGHQAKVDCPVTSHFNLIERIDWYKGSSSSALPLSSDSPGLELLLPAVKVSELGLYTCQLQVLIHNKHYRVSRTILVQSDEPFIGDISVTSDPSIHSRDGHVTQDTAVMPPLILSPSNGTVYEAPHGSGLELWCNVSTGCQTADSTLVTWMVNGQSLKSSYINGRALQGGRRVTKSHGGCQVELKLFVVALTDKDTEAEFKCVTQNEGGTQEAVAQIRLEDPLFTWMVVAAVVICCFLSVVSVFLYFLLKPRAKTDYFLARQNSRTASTRSHSSVYNEGLD